MLKELANRIGDLSNGKLIEFLEEVLNELERDIIELNRSQLEKGQKADGSFNRPYSRSTINVRNIEGNPVKGQLIALYDTGDFWGYFWAQAYNGKLNIWSSDVKTEMLVKEYGEAIFGLTDENFKALGEKATPLLKQKVNTFLRA